MTTTPHRPSTHRNGGDFKQYLGFDRKFGHLHAFNEIPDSQPKTYSARISVPQGQGDHIHYVSFELYVKSAEALIAFLDHREAIDNEDHKVTVRFSCSKVHPRAYIGKSGKYAGQTVAYFAGNLNALHAMKVDGEAVFSSGFNQDKQALQAVAQASETDKDSAEGAPSHRFHKSSNPAVKAVS